MPSLERIRKVVKKLSSNNEFGEQLCYFGGAVPYLFFDKESNREHSDLDVLVDEKYMSIVRERIKQQYHYKPELDSLNLGLNDDYGLKVFIDGVYVEFEPMTIQEGVLTRKSFSPSKKVAGKEQIPFDNLNDLLVTQEIYGIKISFQTMEMIKASKELYKREKDLIDIAFIDGQGIDNEKYERVKHYINATTTDTYSYEKK